MTVSLVLLGIGLTTGLLVREHAHISMYEFPLELERLKRQLGHMLLCQPFCRFMWI